MTVLVTGGAGYIGSHTCVALIEAGYDIAVIDSFATSHRESLRRVSALTEIQFPVYPINLLNIFAVEDIFRKMNIEAIIHFAGLKSVGESVANPLLYYQTNLNTAMNVCAVMQKYGVTKFVFSSSATVYGAQNNMPVTEDMPLSPASPYGQTKAMLESILSDVAIANPDWRVVLLRYFNPIGAHPSGRIGEHPNGIPNNLLPYVSQVAIGKKQFLTVNGDDYPTFDGTCIRDYTHVMDLAEGHVKALEYMQKTPGIEIFNLGTGRGHSVLEIVETFTKVSGASVPYRIGPRRPGDIPVSYADVTKAKTMLGWRARRAMDQMCADTWRWQLQNPNGYSDDNAESGHSCFASSLH